MDVTLFLLQIGVMLAVALVCGQLMRRIGQPAVVGELIGGVILGPTVFGLLFPGAYQRLFATNEAVAIARNGLLTIGMLFFLFIAGLEVSPAQVRQSGPRSSAPASSASWYRLSWALGWSGSSLRFGGRWQRPITWHWPW